MTTASYIDASAVARELLDGAEVDYGYPDQRTTRRLTLPDGRVVALRISFADGFGIGRWLTRHGEPMKNQHHDDVFGDFCWRQKDSETGYLESRPRGFDGRAVCFNMTGNPTARLGSPVWWQPPADILQQSNADDVIAELRSHVERWILGEWFHVNAYVEILENGETVGEAFLSGIDYDFPGDDGEHLVSTVAELLEEAGISKASTAAVAQWAREMLEAVARRISGEDPEDGEAPRYHETLRGVVDWWRNTVEAAGDWDSYADRVVNAIESDYADHLRGEFSGVKGPRPGRSLGVRHGDGCPFCMYGQPPYPPSHHHFESCPNRSEKN